MDLSMISDRELDNLQNAAYRERLQRLERNARSVDASSLKSPIRGGAAMTLAEDGPQAATTHAPTRSFAPPRSIGWAIKQLYTGARVTRAGWNGCGQSLALQVPDGSQLHDPALPLHPHGPR